jgi:hypothetical protein
MHRRKSPFYLAVLVLFSFALYADVFMYDTFGPELPLFYFYTDGLSFTQMLRSYTYTSLMSYRPTSYALFYWVGEQFLHWHNLAAWKLYHFATALAACWAIYWLVVRCLSGSPAAGFFAAIYFIAQPSLYAFVMNPFDFLHVVLTVLCVGFYLRGGGVSTGISWILFVVALTTKEMALAIPLYLFAASAIALVFDRRPEPLRARLRRESLRLLLFFAMLPVYYVVHVAKIPAGTYTDSGPYRMGFNWDMFVQNVTRLPLWMVRIFAFTGETPGQKMYQSNVLNNLVGVALLLLTAAPWIKGGWSDPGKRALLLLMLCWCLVFLILPVYAGGFFWHIHLPVIGYAVLFGVAMAWWLERIPAPRWRGVAASLFLLFFLLLSRENLKAELYGGIHTTGFRINHSLIDHPPVPPERIGKSPLVYIEDRLGIGGWWYGCYGKLFNFVYLRHDIEEVIVPELAEVPQDLRDRWVEHQNAYFFRYDNQYRWRDASNEFRASILQRHVLLPSLTCVWPGSQVQFSLLTRGRQETGPLTWSLSRPGAGDITPDGLYTAPALIPEHQTLRVFAHLAVEQAPVAEAVLTLGGPIPVRIAAGGGTVTDEAGGVWQPDANFEGGHTFFSGGPIEGTGTPELYQNERFGSAPFHYRFCVADGSYTVKLKFAEIWFSKPGSRVFDVAINGVTVLQRFDITAAAGGPRRAIDTEFRVKAVDNQIHIEFRPVVGDAKIGAIEITR